MSNWVVSLAALEKLAKHLADVNVDCEKLARYFDLGETPRGEGSDLLFECLHKLARSPSGFNGEHFEIVEKWFEFRQDIPVKSLKVELDLEEPASPLLTPPELEQLSQLAERASLLEDRRLKAVRQALGPKFKLYSASSDVPREQWRLWLRACSRQDLADGAKPYLAGLAGCAAAACDDANVKQTFAQLRERCESSKPPWNLVDLLGESMPPSSGEPLLRAAAAALGRVAPAELPTGTPKVGYALLIGISKYAAHGPGSLKCAANDAQQLAAYLQGQCDIDFSGDRVRMLTDETATLRGVLGGLDWLRDSCARSVKPDPLAVVYFSGHGMPDRAGRHYLVPHDGDREQLFATALWNRTLNAALEQIPTQRLLVLLDACHAGGMVALEGAKAGVALSYDPDDESEGLRLESRRGRYFIASCAAGQHSFEGEGNGLFTEALLALLRFEGLNEERLDLADLYRHLRKRVNDAARPLAGGRGQTPIGNIDDAAASTGLILAINQRRSNRLRLFLPAVRKYLQENRFPQKTTIIFRLEDFVERDERPEPDDPEFFELFTEGAERWRGQSDEACVKEVCNHLAKHMGAAKAAPEAQVAAARVSEASDFAAAHASGLATASVSSGSASAFPPPTQVPAPATAPGPTGAAIPMHRLRIVPTDG